MAQNLAPIVSPGAQRRIPRPGCAPDFLGYRIMWLMPPARETEGGQDGERSGDLVRASLHRKEKLRDRCGIAVGVSTDESVIVACDKTTAV
ncbi:hypothetical protein K0M31_019113 [Melipona bicolor]|uniref:Uncharacterized protein n=1 Tax=Melipona bicolor TaxID=60889 RepID=A0AA40G284_9HYME|nr:hypothetical protein K0M31_019113 [Melipona bicolor]